MNQQTLTIAKNGVMELPSRLKSWKGAEVMVIAAERDTLIVKRIEKPLRKLSDLASRLSASKMSMREINQEVRSYRNQT